MPEMVAVVVMAAPMMVAVPAVMPVPVVAVPMPAAVPASGLDERFGVGLRRGDRHAHRGGLRRKAQPGRAAEQRKHDHQKSPGSHRDVLSSL